MNRIILASTLLLLCFLSIIIIIIITIINIGIIVDSLSPPMFVKSFSFCPLLFIFLLLFLCVSTERMPIGSLHNEFADIGWIVYRLGVVVHLIVDACIWRGWFNATEHNVNASILLFQTFHQGLSFWIMLMTILISSIC